MSLRLVALAAGVGSRYGGVKQLDGLGPGGASVLDFAVFDAIRAGFEAITFVIRPELEAAFRDRYDKALAGRIAVDYAFQRLDDLPAGRSAPPERTKPWGTAHAVFAARHTIDGPFAVVNADDYYGVSSYTIAADHLRLAPAAVPLHAVVGFSLRRTLSPHGTVSRALCEVADDGSLLGVVERTQIEAEGDAARFLEGDTWHPLTGDEFVSLNFWAFDARFVDELEGLFASFLDRLTDPAKGEFYIPWAVDQLTAAGRCHTVVLPSPESWLGMTYPDDKPVVAEGLAALMASGAYPNPLF